jgi:hypothetical protein
MNWAAWAGVVWSESGRSYSLTLPGGFLGSSCALPGSKRPCALRDSGFFQSGGIPPSAQYSTTTPRATGGYRLQSSEQRQECSSQRSLRIPLRGTALIVPDNGYHGVNADFFRQHMGPKDTEAAHRVNVSVRTHGPTKAQYRCICDEVGETEGVIEFEVREPPRGAPETDTAGSWRGGKPRGRVAAAMAEPFPQRPWWRRVVG